MTIENGNIPLFFQFYLRIRNDIIRGDLQPGERIPTIDQLVQDYDMSQSSILKGLTLLERAELIQKKRSIGIHVRKNIGPVVAGFSPSLNEELNLLKAQKRRLISAKWIEPPKRTVHFFKQNHDVFKDGKIFRIRRIWTLKKNLRWRRLSDVYLPYFLHRDIIKGKKVDLIFIQEVLNSDIYGAGKIISIETIHPWFCDAKLSQYLKIPNGTPIFQQTIRNYSEDQRLLWINEIYPTSQTLIREMQTVGSKNKKNRSHRP
jgi:GntR family transcriptional regulator